LLCCGAFNPTFSNIIGAFPCPLKLDGWNHIQQSYERDLLPQWVPKISPTKVMFNTLIQRSVQYPFLACPLAPCMVPHLTTLLGSSCSAQKKKHNLLFHACSVAVGPCLNQNVPTNLCTYFL
jgi:hypothetical protein